MIFFNVISYLKSRKRGFIYRRTAELTWRAGPAPMRRGTQGHVVEPAKPMRHAGGADTRQEATQVHADAHEGRHVAWGG